MYTIPKSGQMAFKGVNWVDSNKITSYHLEMNQMGTQFKNIPIFCPFS